MTTFKICLRLWKSSSVLCHVGVALVFRGGPMFKNVIKILMALGDVILWVTGSLHYNALQL